MPAVGGSPSPTRDQGTDYGRTPPWLPPSRAWDENQDENAPLAGERYQVEVMAPRISSSSLCRLTKRHALLRILPRVSFPVVLASADSGDRSARDVLGLAGLRLAELAGIVVRRLFPDSGAVRAAMSGGVFASSALVRQAFLQWTSFEHPDVARSIPASWSRCRGALELARQAAARYLIIAAPSCSSVEQGFRAAVGPGKIAAQGPDVCALGCHAKSARALRSAPELVRAWTLRASALGGIVD